MFAYTIYHHAMFTNLWELYFSSYSIFMCDYPFQCTVATTTITVTSHLPIKCHSKQLPQYWTFFLTESLNLFQILLHVKLTTLTNSAVRENLIKLPTFILDIAKLPSLILLQDPFTIAINSKVTTQSHCILKDLTNDILLLTTIFHMYIQNVYLLYQCSIRNITFSKFFKINFSITTTCFLFFFNSSLISS